MVKNNIQVWQNYLKNVTNKGVRRIRMGSIEPIQIDDEFKELINEPFYGKTPSYSTSTYIKEMLKIMNRRNKVLSDLELFEF